MCIHFCMLQTYHNDTTPTLNDYGVKQMDTIYLVFLLYSVPQHLDNVVFDLHWGYPLSGVDFLDASCLAFNNTTLLAVLDYQHRSNRFLMNSVIHSGDRMYDTLKRGHHIINISMKNIPEAITHLFFTLSAFNSPTISRYPNPSLKFYEELNKGVNLCKTSFTHALYSEAVVMCSMSRDSDGNWNIYESGKLSSGNAANYTPLVQTIQRLITQGF